MPGERDLLCAGDGLDGRRFEAARRWLWLWRRRRRHVFRKGDGRVEAAQLLQVAQRAHPAVKLAVDLPRRVAGHLAARSARCGRALIAVRRALDVWQITRAAGAKHLPLSQAKGAPIRAVHFGARLFEVLGERNLIG